MAEQQRPNKRVSLACAQCRAKHMRCDATKPTCSRCLRDEQDCNYLTSKRGGLTRASLAALRARKNAVANDSDARGTLADLQGTSLAAESAYSTESRSPSHNSSTLVPTMLSAEVNFEPVVVQEDEDIFVDVYFKCFHRYHPCVLPASRLRQYFDNPLFHQHLLPTMAVIRLIGSIYARSSRSEVLLEEAESAIAKALERTPRCPFLAQALLLCSVSTYWSQDEDKSRRYMDLALDTALQIGMNSRGFAIDNAPEDSVLQECFRRTWWQIYVIDAAYASIKRTATFRAAGVISDVELPCDEDDYDCGIIPAPSTLAEFDRREFEENEKVYSSFAYLIGIIRALSHASSVGTWQSDGIPTPETVAAIDAVVDGWLLLLPEAKQIMNSSDEIDELLYFATMWIHATIICYHRALSDIILNPLETLSSCVGPAPRCNLPGRLRRIHTTRCLSSIHRLVSLLTLPKQPFCHSPFVICMVVVGTLPYLSACAGLLQGGELELARHHIRLIIGCLKAMGDVWKKGEGRTRELQTIGKEILFGASPRAQAGGDTATTLASADNIFPSYDIPQAVFNVEMFPTSMGTSEGTELWPTMNPELHISTWITNSFGKEHL